MRSFLTLVLSLLMSLEGIAFSANVGFTAHSRLRRTYGGLQSVGKTAHTEVRHSLTRNSTPAPDEEKATQTKPPTFEGSGRSGQANPVVKDACLFCGRRLNSLTQFCSEERELYGFPVSIFNHTRRGHYEVNILKNNGGNERVGQVLFPEFFKGRVAKCQCWDIKADGKNSGAKWPIRLTFGFPPDGKEDMVTSISRLMKKADSLVCPLNKSKERAKFYLAEANALRRGLPIGDSIEILKLVKTGRKETIVKSSVAPQKTAEKSHQLGVISQRAPQISKKHGG